MVSTWTLKIFNFLVFLCSCQGSWGIVFTKLWLLWTFQIGKKVTQSAWRNIQNGYSGFEWWNKLGCYYAGEGRIFGYFCGEWNLNFKNGGLLDLAWVGGFKVPAPSRSPKNTEKAKKKFKHIWNIFTALQWKWPFEGWNSKQICSKYI